MLRLFEVSGFKNFDNTISLDFSDVRDYKFNKNCITKDLISKIIIYGKNSVGKTNIGLAIFDIVTHLTSMNEGPGLYNYYLNSSNLHDNAKFHYVFSFADDLVDYTYHKDDKQELVYERLSLNDELLFEYYYDTNISSGNNLDGIKKIAPTLNWEFQNTDSILKYVINNTILDDNHPLRQMMRFVSNMLWFRSIQDERFIGYKTKSTDYYDFIFEEDTLKEFEDLLHSAGIDENLRVETNIEGKKVLYFDTPSPMSFFSIASSGTKALYSFFYWYKTAPDVTFLFIDEFDAFYHYELAESIVSILERMENTQVILTTHNTNLLTNRIMRPDCYFILTKEKITSLANATARELREGHNLEKLYKSGEFDE